jgi:hypothetical protein
MKDHQDLRYRSRRTALRHARALDSSSSHRTAVIAK